MLAALDSSFNRPTLAQAQQAFASGVRAWGGYLVSDSDAAVLASRSRGWGMRGLAAPWTLAEFDVLRQAGLTPIGFCSGNDSASAIRAKAYGNGIVPCVDVEPGIREDGPWVRPWVVVAQSGLYGAMSVHYQQGEPEGREALFNIMAWYFVPVRDPQATWYDAIDPRPPGPCGWQWWGDHQEFGLSVDRSWLDDEVLPVGPGRGGAGAAISGGGSMGSLVTIADSNGFTHRFTVVRAYNADGTPTNDPEGNRGGPVHYARISGGPGGIQSFQGGDEEMPGGGGWIAGGTLSGELWPWVDAPGGPRELVIVHGRGANAALWMKSFNTDGTVHSEWSQVGGRPSPCIPGADSASGPGVDESQVRAWAVDAVEKALENG
jgi:hypothetical protein